MSHRTLEQRLIGIGWTESPTGCWIFNGKKHDSGYGRITGVVDGRKRDFYAHRVAHELWIGPLAGSGEVVCHSCDIPACINPAHLFSGTVADNSADMVAKRRNPNGERSPVAVLSDADVDQIRALYSTGLYTQKEIATAYGVTRQHVSKLALFQSRWNETNAAPLIPTVKQRHPRRPAA